MNDRVFLRVLASVLLALSLSGFAVRAAELVGVPSNAVVACGAVPPAPAVTLANPCATNEPPVTNGLVLHFAFTQGGILAQDGSGYTNRGYVLGPTHFTNGHVGPAYSFDGINDYIQISNSPSLTPSNVSLSLWIRPDRTYSNNEPLVFFSKEQPGSAGGYVLKTDAGAVSFMVMATNLYVPLLHPMTLQAGQWYHLAGTYNGSVSRLYVNGVAVGETSRVLKIRHTGVGPRIGCSLDTPAQAFFNGLIDEVRVYNRGLSAGEVASLYTDAQPGSQVLLQERIDGACPQVLSRVWTGLDPCSNLVSATQTITIVDTQAPTLQGVPADLLLHCGMPVPTATVVTAIDGCSSVQVSFVESVTGDCPAVLTRTWSAVDACGNGTSATQIVTFQPAQPPVLLGVPSNLVVDCSITNALLPTGVTATTTCPFNDPPPSNGLSLYYAFGAAGSNVTDESGNGNAGTVSASGPTHTPDGISGAAYRFDGLDDRIDVASSASLTPSNVSVSVWIRPERTYTNESLVFFTKEQPGYAAGYVLKSDAQGLCFMVTGTNVYAPLYHPSVLQSGRWYHIVGTYDGQVQRLYLDGVLARQTNRAVTLRHTAVGMRLGASLDAPPQAHFKGVIDEVCVYRRALPADEVASLNRSGSNRLAIVYAESTTGTCPAVVERVWMATDPCGGIASATQTVTIIDTAAPVLTGVPADASLACGDPVPSAPTVTAVDNCGTVAVVFAEAATGTCPATITRTWTSIDACGNGTTATQIITFDPVPPPVLAGVPDDLTVDCASIPPPAAVTATGMCHLAAPMPADGLVLRYSFTAAATNATDESGNGNHGTLVGPVSTLDGRTGNACRFDGINDRIDIPNAASLTPSNVSVSVWLRPDRTYTNESLVFVSKEQPGSPGGYVVKSDSQGLCFMVMGTATYAPLYQPAVLQSGQWYHIVGTFDGQDQRLYLDGVLVRQTNRTLNIRHTSVGLRIGASLDFPPQAFFQGSIDEVRIYNRALTTGEVSLLNRDRNGFVDVRLTEQTAGTCPAVLTRVWTAVDGCGNSIGATQRLTVVDTTAPVLTGAPGDLRLTCGDPIPGTATVTAVDGCGTSVVLFAETSTGSCPTTITRTWTAIDACGNASSAVQRIVFVPEDGDRDGLRDVYETGTGLYLSPTNTGTDALKADTDGDGATDGWEVRAGTDPNATNSRPRAVHLDFDGDGLSDIGCYFAPGGNWYELRSREGFASALFGFSGTLPVVGDFDGDLHADIGCYYPAGGNWFFLRSRAGFATATFGFAGTLPVVGDFDGDGRTDYGCYYPTGGNWYLMKSRDGFATATFGFAGTLPVVGDFDGDGRSDIGCYYPAGGNWYFLKSTAGFATATFGFAGTLPVVGDFDGDGKTDYGCYYPAGGNWYFMKSRDGFATATFGYGGTEPVVGDFDGDGRADYGCYYAPGGNWYLMKSTAGFTTNAFGYGGTVPLR